jgi:hypothetical protein
MQRCATPRHTASAQDFAPMYGALQFRLLHSHSSSRKETLPLVMQRQITQSQTAHCCQPHAARMFPTRWCQLAYNQIASVTVALRTNALSPSFAAVRTRASTSLYVCTSSAFALHSINSGEQGLWRARRYNTMASDPAQALTKHRLCRQPWQSDSEH